MRDQPDLLSPGAWTHTSDLSSQQPHTLTHVKVLQQCCATVTLSGFTVASVVWLEQSRTEGEGRCGTRTHLERAPKRESQDTHRRTHALKQDGHCSVSGKEHGFLCVSVWAPGSGVSLQIIGRVAQLHCVEGENTGNAVRCSAVAYTMFMQGCKLYVCGCVRWSVCCHRGA